MDRPAITDVGVSRISPSEPSLFAGRWADNDFTEYPRTLGPKYSPSVQIEKDICEWPAKKVIHYKQLGELCLWGRFQRLAVEK